MESVKLATKPRPGHGSRAAKKLRREGLIPAVVYGHKQAAVGLAVDRKELETALRHNARVVDLQLDGAAEIAVIQEVQFDHLGTGVVHVDFKRVDKDERVKVAVR